MAFANLFINIRAGTSALAGDMNKASSIVSGFDKQVAGVAASIKGAFAGALGGFAVAGFLKDSLHAFAEQETATNRLKSVFEATENAARLSVKNVEDFATELQRTTRFADETTIAAASLLATFDKIKGDTFTRALSTAADVATIKGLAIGESATLIGKALQAPADSFGKLKKAGIIFDDQMQRSIRSMVAMGDSAGAQTAILDEFNKRFGGAAVKDIETYSGAVDQLKNSFDELKEAVGGPLANFLTHRIKGIQQLLESRSLEDAFKAIAQYQVGGMIPIPLPQGPRPGDAPPKPGTPFAMQQLFRSPGDFASRGKAGEAITKLFTSAGGDHFERGDKFFAWFKEKQKELQRLAEEGKRVFDETRTPQERFTKRIQDLSKMFEVGAVNEQTFDRAAEAAKRELERATQAHSTTAGLAEAGSQEAFAAIARHQSKQVEDPVVKEMIANEKKAAVDRKESIAALKRIQAAVEKAPQIAVVQF